MLDMHVNISCKVANMENNEEKNYPLAKRNEK